MDWLLAVAHWFGAAVCDQLPTHSYAFAGVVLPLCARCTGMYLGALVTLAFYAWRHPRASGLPHPWVLLAFVFFFFAWAGDGVNSFLATIPSAPHLYAPHNLLRLTTGALMGVTIGSLVFVMFHSLFWRTVDPTPILGSAREFGALLGLDVLLVLVVRTEWAPLLYPLNLAILLAILTLHTLLVGAFVASITHRAGTWRGTRRVLVVGFVIALVYLDAFALAHRVLYAAMGIPF